MNNGMRRRMFRISQGPAGIAIAPALDSTSAVIIPLPG
jgi:hypothetical protein